MYSKVVLVAVFFVLVAPVMASAQNNPPVVDAGPDQTIYLGDSVTLHGTATGDPGLWQWEVVSAPTGSNYNLLAADTADATFSTDTLGDYLITLTAWNYFGWSDPDAVVVTVVQNQPPTAVASAAPLSGPAPLTVNFDATGSSDPEGGDLLYDWDFDDGTFGPGATPLHTYDLPGTYFAVLTVFDERGLADFDTVEITVLPNPVPLPATDSGRYSSSGFHDPANTEYVASVGGTRSFFVFDLTSLTDPRPIVSATLVLDTGTVTSGGFGGITYTLYDVSTPILTLVTGGDGLTTIYDDLGSGVPFSAATEIEPGTSGTDKSIPLLAAGVATLETAKGGLVAIGGGPSGLGGNFAFDGTDVSGARLVIEFGAFASVPSIHPIGLYVLLPSLLVGAGLVAMRRSGGRR